MREDTGWVGGFVFAGGGMGWRMREDTGGEGRGMGWRVRVRGGRDGLAHARGHGMGEVLGMGGEGWVGGLARTRDGAGLCWRGEGWVGGLGRITG